MLADYAGGMAAGHGTGYTAGAAVAGVGGAVVAAAAAQAAPGADSASGGWFVLGVVAVGLGILILAVVATHHAVTWWRSRRGAPPAQALRKPLVLTMRDLHTGADFMTRPNPVARTLVEIRVGLYAANPGSVPIRLLATRIEHVRFQMYGQVQMPGLATGPEAPLVSPDPDDEEGVVVIDEADPHFTHPPIVPPGETVLLHCSYWVGPPASAGLARIVPQWVEGEVVLVDELHTTHRAPDLVRCPVSMSQG